MSDEELCHAFASFSLSQNALQPLVPSRCKFVNELFIHAIYPVESFLHEHPEIRRKDIYSRSFVKSQHASFFDSLQVDAVSEHVYLATFASNQYRITLQPKEATYERSHGLLEDNTLSQTFTLKEKDGVTFILPYFYKIPV